jgi:hypothetical protein
MQYLCLVRVDEAKFNALSQKELDALDDENLANDDELRRSGHLVLSGPLEAGEAATTVRVRNGRLSATDGPFAETTELVGGFLLIEARDLNEAIQIAGNIPMARFGSIEVRPVLDLQQKVRERPAR